MSKHKWANEIIAWANGTQIEELAPTSGRWMLVFNPSWAGPNSFRIYDPYRELKEAKERGETIQQTRTANQMHWFDDVDPTWSAPPNFYRIKPREPLVRWIPAWGPHTSLKAYPKPVKLCSLVQPDRWIEMREVVKDEA